MTREEKREIIRRINRNFEDTEIIVTFETAEMKAEPASQSTEQNPDRADYLQ